MKKQQQELEFLPAALEIQDTPPSPIGRIIIWTIMLFFVIAVVWAIIGKVDIVAVAQGKIIPNGYSKIIQPLEIGTVRQIHIHEGQEVNKGDILIELDSIIVKADLRRLDEEIQTLQYEINRLRQLAKKTGLVSNDNKKTPSLENTNYTQAQNAENQLQKNILASQWAEYQSRLAALQGTLNKRKAESNTLQQQIKKLEAIVPMVVRRADDLRRLADKKVIAEYEYLELEQERIEHVHDLQTQQSRVKVLAAATQEAKSELRNARTEFRRNILLELAEAEKNLAAIRQEQIKAQARTASQTLIAPVAGVVQQLAVHTIGGIVTPAQELMTIVPKSQTLEVEALLENKDIGFVHEGQVAEVKIETFPFTKYGVINANIINISNDAIPDEKRGLVYKVRILMEQSVIQVGDRLVNLSPGMAVTVEVKTGKRRLIEFVLAPLLRYKQESVRER